MEQVLRAFEGDIARCLARANLSVPNGPLWEALLEADSQRDLPTSTDLILNLSRTFPLQQIEFGLRQHRCRYFILARQFVPKPYLKCARKYSCYGTNRLALQVLAELLEESANYEQNWHKLANCAWIECIDQQAARQDSARLTSIGAKETNKFSV